MSASDEGKAQSGENACSRQLTLRHTGTKIIANKRWRLCMTKKYRLWLMLVAVLAIVPIIGVVVQRNAAHKPALCTMNSLDYSEGAVVRTGPDSTITCHQGKWIPGAD